MVSSLITQFFSSLLDFINYVVDFSKELVFQFLDWLVEFVFVDFIQRLSVDDTGWAAELTNTSFVNGLSIINWVFPVDFFLQQMTLFLGLCGVYWVIKLAWDAIKNVIP